MEQCQRILTNEPRNITALTLLAQNAVTQEGNAGNAQVRGIFKACKTYS